MPTLIKRYILEAYDPRPKNVSELSYLKVGNCTFWQTGKSATQSFIEIVSNLTKRVFYHLVARIQTCILSDMHLVTRKLILTFMTD